MMQERTLAGTLDRSADDSSRDRAGLPFLIHSLQRKSGKALPELGIPLSEGRLVRLGRGERDGLIESKDHTRLDLADPTVSTQHATLHLERTDGGDRLRVRDEGSSNGTIVRGERVEEALLEEGDWMMVGGHVYVFRTVPLGWLGFARGGDSKRLFVGQGVASYQLLEQLRPIAATRVPVILHGPTGSGKEVIARELHRLSDRPGKLVGVNCGAMPEHLIESELFGHVRGAFSGAVENKQGLIRAAHEGTLLLDEVGEMPLAAQVRLLRVLQESEVTPIGSTQAIAVDVRVVAASHRPLEQLVQTGTFRPDLHARLHGLLLSLPPMTARTEDIGLLFNEGLERAGGEPGKPHLTAGAAQALFGCAWPYNVRQIMQVASVAVPLAGEGPIRRQHLQGIELAAPTTPPAVTAAATPGTPADQPATAAPAEGDPVAAVLLTARRRKEDPDAFRTALTHLMGVHDDNVTRVAEAAGVSRMQLYRWLKWIGWERG